MARARSARSRVLQILLALAFLAAGLTKLTQPRQKLATTMGWVGDFSDPGVRAIGALEVLGALGCCAGHHRGGHRARPPRRPGLAVVMVGAAATHRRRGELPMIGINTVLLILALVVAWARFGPYSL